MSIGRWAQFILLFAILPGTHLYAADAAGQSGSESAPAETGILTFIPEIGLQDTAVLDTEIVYIDNAPVSGTRDIVLVLDNSGSMKKKDPEQLVRQTITEFVLQMDNDVHSGIVIFDQDVRTAVPLNTVTGDRRTELLAGLELLNYNGLFTDIPSAIERAVYELKNNGRGTSEKYVIFITDGSVDTGNQDRNLEKSEWLINELVPEANAAQIRIFAVGFGGDADFELTQSLAQGTGGEYYRVLQAADLRPVFSEINTLLQQTDVIPAPEVFPPPEAPPESPAFSPPVETDVVNPVQVGSEERVRSIIILVAGVILIFTLVALIFLLFRRGKEHRESLADNVNEAYLTDLSGQTPHSHYKLSKKATMLGRVEGKDSAYLDYIVVPESTIGRRHALIEYKDYAYWILDQGSINGTFVNDIPVRNEVRLKHGDKIRLHRVEFQFLMPELDGAAMTEVSRTVLSGQQEVGDSDIASIRENIASTPYSLDLDFSGTEGSSADSEDETLMPGHETAPGHIDSGSEDETLLPEFEKNTAYRKPGNVANGNDTMMNSGDETLLPGHMEDIDEDATIRPENKD